MVDLYQLTHANALLHLPKVVYVHVKSVVKYEHFISFINQFEVLLSSSFKYLMDVLVKSWNGKFGFVWYFDELLCIIILAAEFWA